ncbi:MULTISPECIES: acyltransferase family protein [unclassified Geodermatophilus]
MLDVLRLFAAMAVMGFHFTARDSPAWDGPVPEAVAPVGEWTTYGRLGVPLFFVISGFVLLMSSWNRDLPDFIASRAGRLFPAYWAAVTISIVLVLVLWPENPAFFDKQVGVARSLLNLTMVQAAFGVPDLDGVYWTLWYEARFYALIALLMLWGITRGRVLAFCALWPIVGAIAAATHSDLLTVVLMPDYAPFFSGGMLLFVVHRDGHDLGTWLLVGMQALFGLNFAMGYYPGALSDEVPWPPSKVGIALATLACFGLVALVTLTPLATTHARWMPLAGALTYPLYLIHENLGWYVIHLFRDSTGPWAAIGLATAVSCLVGLALHHLVEKPCGPRLRRATLGMLQGGGRGSERVGVSAPAPVDDRPLISRPHAMRSTASAPVGIPRHSASRDLHRHLPALDRQPRSGRTDPRTPRSSPDSASPVRGV